MKKILIATLLLLTAVFVRAQSFPNVDSVKKYIADSITAARVLKASSLNKAYIGIAKFLPDVVQDTSTVALKAHGMTRFQRKDSTLYIWDTIIVPKRWRKAVTPISGGGSPIDTTGKLLNSIYRKQSRDSFYYKLNGVEYAVKDSTGGTADTIIGHFINETFTSPSALPSSFANHGATVAPSSVGLRLSGAASTFYTKYISGTAVSGSLNNAIVTEFVTEVKPSADTQSVYVGKLSTNGAAKFDLAIKCKRVSTSLWKAYLYLNTNLTVQLVDSTNVAITMGNFEKYRLVYNIGNGYAFCSFARIDSTLSRPGDELESSSMMYRYDYRPLGAKSVPNVGQAWIGSTGGTYRITKYDEIHADLKHVFAVHFGTSISTKYSAYSVNNTWVSKLYEGTSYKYALLSGGGERIVDFITQFQQAKAMHPTVIFIEGGINESDHNEVRAYLNDIIDSCQLYGYIPIVVKTWSRPERDSTMFNVCKAQNVLLIDAGQVIYPAYETAEGTGGVHILAAAYEKVANIVRTQMLASGYMEVGRNVQGTGFGDLTDYEYLGLDDGFVPVFDTSSNRRRYKAKDLKVYLNGSYINNQSAIDQPADLRVSGTGSFGGFVGVGAVSTGLYKIEVTRNTAADGQGILLKNSGVSGVGLGEFSLSGPAATYTTHRDAAILVSYLNNGITYDAAGGHRWNTGTINVTQMNLNSTGLYIGGSAAATHALTVNGQVRITAVTASTNSSDSAAVFSGGAIKTIAHSDSTYTPTLTNVTNVASSTVSGGSFHFMRSGNQVSFSGVLTVTPTANTTVTQIGISLPVASNFLATIDAAGVLTAVGATYNAGLVYGDITNDRLQLEFISSSTSSHTVSITGHYTAK